MLKTKHILLTVVAGSMVTSCSTTDPTEIVPGVTTQIQVPKAIKGIGVVIQRTGQAPICEYVSAVDGVAILPGTVGVLKAEETASGTAVSSTVLAFHEAQNDFETACLTNGVGDADKPEIRVLRKRRTTYIDERILYLPIPLKESCAGVACGEDETCVGGACESIDIDPESLVNYSDDLIFGNTNTCFSVSTCMAASVPATLIDASNCTFDLNVPDVDGEAFTPTEGNLNVRIVYSSFNTEVLDLDDKEGFVVPDPAQPLRFKLADNLCESNYKQGKILAVSASPLCLSKRALQPICADDLEDILNGEPSPIGGDPLSECSVPDKLVQSPSALYVLMDRSDSMSGFFGDQGLAFALDTSLNNPIADRTQVAFSFIPSDNAAAECSASNSYGTPSIGFGTVDEMRAAIAAALGDTNNVLASDPDLYLDAALRGDSAYQTLRNLMPPMPSPRFNRRALMIVGNRDFTDQCAAETSAQLAAAAFADSDKVYTYTVVLEAPSTTVLSGAPVGDAAAIATAGGTTGFDVTVNPEEGAKAVQGIVNDLGSCLYDAPNIIALDDADALEDVTVAYLDPLTLERTSVSYNVQCTETSTGVDGWSVAENGGIRICGAPCANLRDVLTDVALLAAVQEATAPEIPVVASAPCGSDAISPSD